MTVTVRLRFLPYWSQHAAFLAPPSWNTNVQNYGSWRCWTTIGSFSSGLHERVHTRDQANFEGTSPWDWSHEFKPVWIRGTNFGDQNSVPATRDLTKIGRSHGGTWSPGQVPATGPCNRSSRVLRPLAFVVDDGFPRKICRVSVTTPSYERGKSDTSKSQ